MDAGALGVMVAMSKPLQQARSIVDAVKYAPLGKRGVALGTAHNDYVMPDPEDYFREINKSSVVICQIESELGVRQSEAIAATAGRRPPVGRPLRPVTVDGYSCAVPP